MPCSCHRPEVPDQLLPSRQPWRCSSASRPWLSSRASAHSRRAPAQHPIGLAAQPPDGIGRCHQQTDDRPHGQVVEVVTDEGGVVTFHAQVGPQLLEALLLVAHTHTAVLDVKVSSSLLDGAATATAEQGHADAGPLQHPYRQSIAHVKALQHPAVLVVMEAAIGEHAIHITDQQPDLA